MIIRASAVKKIQDYAIIGNCRSAALVSDEGSIDWLCWPYFHSQPVFANLLDDNKGHWSIAPSAEFTAHRKYIPRTNVLQTKFVCSHGEAVLTDLMPVACQAEYHHCLSPEHEILRKVECINGEMEIVFDLSFSQNGLRPEFRKKSLGIHAFLNHGILILKGSVDFTLTRWGVHARFSLKEGETAYFSLSFSEEAPAVLTVPSENSETLINGTVKWWRDFSQGISYKGPYEEMVVRSALLIKLMGYSPSGAIIASPTTSLPERLGGDLNWDYRYCWLRDASLTTGALMRLNLFGEANAFVNWLLHATNLTRPKLKVLYDIYGRYPVPERVLSDFKGYRGSRPVRIGNKAADQHQLDIYGEVICSAVNVFLHAEKIDKETQKMLKGFSIYICRHWMDEDAGMWETRGVKAHFTHSLLLCWAGLNGLLKLYHKDLVRGLDAVRVKKVRDDIAEAIQTLAWNHRRQSYTATLCGEDVDANLLLLPDYGFIPFDSPYMKKTYERICRELFVDGLLYRNHDYKEGAFVLCSFWLVEYLANIDGKLQEAEELFHYLLGCANDVGLYSEEIDPVTGDFLGNFPLTFSHLGLINAALALQEKRTRQKELDKLEERLTS